MTMRILDMPKLTRLLEAYLLLCCALIQVELTYGYTTGGNAGFSVPFIGRQDIVGIWRLRHGHLLLPSSGDTKCDQNEDITLRLNEDGTFSCNESEGGGNSDDELHNFLTRGGCWEYQDKKLILAADRPDDGSDRKVHDLLLSGRVITRSSQSLSEDSVEESVSLSEEELGRAEDGTEAVKNNDFDIHLSIMKGDVSIGKFMYPKKHKAFFDEPMLFHETKIGSFELSQLLGSLNARLKKERQKMEDNETEAKFHKKDFYGRKFLLTSEPNKVNQIYAKADKHYDESKAKYDLRVMPITFHSNNTFTATGTEKILRGRYGISGSNRDQLWFQVNIFGAGRTAPGSVYSEGRALSAADDRRGYKGSIQSYNDGNNNTLYHIQGDVFYGNEWAYRKRPTPDGIFSMQQILPGGDDDEEDIEGEDKDNDGNNYDGLQSADDSTIINDNDAFQ